MYCLQMTDRKALNSETHFQNQTIIQTLDLNSITIKD